MSKSNKREPFGILITKHVVQIYSLDEVTRHRNSLMTVKSSEDSRCVFNENYFPSPTVLGGIKNKD